MISWFVAIDERFALWIQAHVHNSVLDIIFPKLTVLGEVGMIWIVIGLLMLAFKKTRKWGIVLLLVLALEGICNELVLKNIVQRTRPCLDYPHISMLVSIPDSYSFPSGHAASSFACATVLYRCHKKWGIVALVFAAILAFSRIYLFVHYPFDVLAGTVLGILLAVLVCAVLKKAKQLPPRLA